MHFIGGDVWRIANSRPVTMTSPYYKDAHRFSPSKEALQHWMNTRKPGNSIAAGHPGLFTTIEYSKDLAWTFVAGFIELLALVLTTYGALNHYAQQQNTAVLFVTIIAVVLFVAFDLIGVLLHGADRSKKVISLAKAKVVNDQQIKKDLIKVAEQTTTREFFGTLFLMLSALIKIGAVLLLFGFIGASIPMIVVLVMFYITVIYIHVAHTGYWLEARKTSKRFRREWEVWWKDFQESNTTGSVNQKIVFRSPQPLQKEELQNGRQVVRSLREVDEDGVKMYELEIESKGIMWDEDVTALLSNVAPGWLQDTLRTACIRMQLQHMDIVPGPAPRRK